MARNVNQESCPRISLMKAFTGTKDSFWSTTGEETQGTARPIAWVTQVAVAIGETEHSVYLQEVLSLEDYFDHRPNILPKCRLILARLGQEYCIGSRQSISFRLRKTGNPLCSHSQLCSQPCKSLGTP